MVYCLLTTILLYYQKRALIKELCMEQKIVIVGGGFGGARAAQDLVEAGFKNTTLIDKKDYFEVTFAALRSLVEPEMSKRSRVRYADFIKGAFQQGEVTTITEKDVTLADGTSIAFDIGIIATGSSYKTFPIAKSQKAMKIAVRENEVSAAQGDLEKAQNILIIGGGSVGVELAGEIADHYPGKKVTIAEGGARLLQELKPRASAIAQKKLEALGVEILYNTRPAVEDKIYQDADAVYNCVGLVPNTALMKSHFADKLDQAGRIKVDDLLRVEGYEHIFAIGDSSNTPEAKKGYLADMQAVLLARNIVAKVKNKPMAPYRTKPAMALVPIGRKGGLMQLPFGVTTLKFLVNMKQKDMFIGRQLGILGVGK